MKKLKTIWILALTVMTLMFLGCSSDSSTTPIISDDGSASSATALTGTAAAGVPIIGRVIVKGANGNRVSEEIEADGTYDIDVSSLTAPYRLRAEGTVGGRRYELHSYATEANLGGTVNITPFTDLIISNAAGQLASNFFDSDAKTEIDSADLETQKEALKEKLQTVLTELGVASTVDLLTTSFNADHSELDAALDLVKVEYNTDTNVATLTNLVDNTSITDSIVDDDQDDTEALGVTEGLSTAQTELVAIDTRMKAFAAMITSNNFTQTQIEAYLADTFIDEDVSKSQWASEITSEDTSDFVLLGAVISDLNITSGKANVTLTDNEGTWTWRVEKISGTWMILGNQEIVEYWTTFAHCNRNQTIDGFDSVTGTCGVNAMVIDENPNNNNEAGAILSAKLDVIRDGSVRDTTIYLGESPYVPGEIQVFNYNGNNINGSYWGDWVGGFDQLGADYVKAGDEFRIQLYASELNVTEPVNPTISGDVIATYYSDEIPADPKLSPTSSDYPSFSQTTLDIFETINSRGGTLNVTVTIPEGHTLDEVWYEAWNQNGEKIKLEDEGTPSTTTSFEIPDMTSSSKFSVGDTVTQRIRVYSVDEDGQVFSTFYTAQDITVSETDTAVDTTPGTGTPTQADPNMTMDGKVFYVGYSEYGIDAVESIVFSATTVTWTEVWKSDGSTNFETGTDSYTKSGNIVTVTEQGEDPEDVTIELIYDNGVEVSSSDGREFFFLNKADAISYMQQ